MEIAPIAGIRVLPVQRIRPVDPELSPLFDLEALTRTGDEENSRYTAKSAGAEENEEDTQDLIDEELEADSIILPPLGQISFFA